MAESTGSSDTTDPERELEDGYLYAVLTYNGELALWNWAFFIPDPSKSPIGSSGVLFRIVPEAEDRRAWKYMTEKHDVLSWPLVVAIVQLGDISSLGEYDNLIAKDGLIPIFEQVRLPMSDPFEYSDSSRTCFREMIEVLNDCGVLSCYDTTILDREIRRYAFFAMDRYLQHEGWSTFTAENCC